MSTFKRIPSKLVFYVIITFVITTAGVLLTAGFRIERVIDQSQKALYEERLHNIVNVLDYHAERLAATGWREAYLEDFQQAALAALRSTYHVNAASVSPVIINHNGRIVMPSEGANRNDHIHDTLPTGMFSHGKSGNFSFTDKEDHRQWAIYRHFPDWGWIVAYIIPHNIKYAESRHLQTDLLLIMTLIAGIAATLLSLLVRRMLKPVTELTEAAAALASDNAAYPVKVKSDDEFGMLAQTFIRMRNTIREKINELASRNKELSESEERFRQAILKSPVAMAVTTPEGAVTSINNRFVQLFGYGEEEIGSFDAWFRQVEPDSAETPEISKLWHSGINEYFQTGIFPTMTTPLHCRDGSLRDVELNFEAVGNQHITSFIDVSERNKAQNALLREKQFSEHLISSMPGLFFLFRQVEKRFLLVKWNQNLETVLGYSAEELVDAPVSFFFHQNDVPHLNTLFSWIAKQGSLEAEVELLTKDGESIPFYMQALLFTRGEENFIMGTCLDLSELKQAEEERRKLQHLLVQSQKMEAIGTLAGGIAHDFNNILSAIIGYTELSLLETPAESEVSGYLANLLEAGNRARDLVQQILTFSRQTEHEPKPILVRAITKEVAKLLSASLPSSIEIRQHITSESFVLAEATHIHQILMNLCTNAGHAMGDEGGVLHIELTNVIIDSDTRLQFADLAPGSYIKLMISDTGSGMSPEVLERIFDPFFTTKEKGKGTGMGLAVVHGLVKSYSGTIHVYSTPGEGSSFNVYLPVAQSDLAKAEEHAILDNYCPQGNEHILLVDDEPDIVLVVEVMLTNLGYHVTTATGSTEAWNLFQEAPSRFDLVITDMTMPAMQGDQLAARILSLSPNTPIILCTGFSHRISRENLETMGFKGLLMKPIIRVELAGLVREVLDAASSPPRSVKPNIPPANEKE